MTICASDISKAFDRVDHYKLLSVLMDNLIKQLIGWYLAGLQSVLHVFGGVICILVGFQF